jgi:hypothetical protein
VGTAALGHALGYEGSDANIARTIYRLEAGRSILKPIGRLLEMFDAFGGPLARAGERAERQHNARPQSSPAGALASEGTFLEATLHMVASLERRPVISALTFLRSIRMSVAPVAFVGASVVEGGLRLPEKRLALASRYQGQ